MKIWEQWNKIGKIKALIIFVHITFIVITLKASNSDLSLSNGEYLGVGVVFFFLTIFFLTPAIKILSLLGIKFQSPSWNKVDSGLSILQFMGYLFAIVGWIQISMQLLFYQEVKGDYSIMAFVGIGILGALQLSKFWLKLNKTQNKST
jgi:hypothetical protein